MNRLGKRLLLNGVLLMNTFDFTSFYAEKIAGEPGEVGAYHILNELKTTIGKSYFEKR